MSSSSALPDQNPPPATPAHSPADAPGELSKAYKPAEHEPRIWDRWIALNAFHADPNRVLRGEAKPYAIVIPPPNVTDRLHLGHALNNTLQDILARAHRMMGFETLWMPGTDHAGIATQAVVERRVMKEEKKRRTDFTREAFVAKIQAFKDEYEAVITGQLKKMGCSCDWDRQRFTMDDQCAKAVREAFFRLFKDSLIYRGKRLVNWDPVLQTAVADDECYDEEIDGAFYYLRYPLVHAGARERGVQNDDKLIDAQPVTWGELARVGYEGAREHPADAPAWITVATTRPETYLGDTAVALNPHDPRAKALRGLCVELPLVGRIIPIVEDAYVVLPERYARTVEEKNDPKAAMATGFLKVTPAHDPNDYEIGRRHNLPVVNVLAPDATISDQHGWNDVGDAKIFLGKKREDARKLVVKEFQARTIGHEPLFEGSKPHRHSVKHSDRSKVIIEPYLSDQWYVKVTDERLAPAANAALTPAQRASTRGTESRAKARPAGDGALTFHPARYAKSYEHWHENIRDWCISRQLWWGHRVPVWYTGEHGLPSADAYQRFVAQLDTWSSQGRISVQHHDWRDNPGEQNPARFERSRARYSVCIRSEADTEVIQYLERMGFSHDQDVLDTWFSSALWPMSTLGWPDSTDLLKAFNPTSALCTAREIITLWVSRMVMFNRYFLGDCPGHGPVPFRDVFIHAVIQDGEGRKMSKSLGNGVDPLDIIATHGADAMRFTLAHMTTQTQDVRLPVVKDSATGKNTSPKFDLGRNFANKLWNAARFALGILRASSEGTEIQRGEVKSLDGQTSSTPSLRNSVSSSLLPDRWMLSRLASAAAGINTSLEHFEFSDYAAGAYTLLWNDFCDWYLEAIKPSASSNPAQRAVLAAVLESIVRLLHPIMPFVTEAIDEKLRSLPTPSVPGVRLDRPRGRELLCLAAWPEIDDSLRDHAAESEFERVRAFVTAIRDVRAKHQVKPSRRITLHLANNAALSKEQLSLAMTLAGLDRVGDAPAPAGSTLFTFESREFGLSNLADAAEADAAGDAERHRLTRQIADLEKSASTLEARLANPGYADKAPPHMVQQTRDQLSKIRGDLDAARAALAKLAS